MQHKKVTQEFEKTIKNANNLNAVCEAIKQLHKMKSAPSTPSAASDQHNKSTLIERGTLFSIRRC